MNFKLGTTYKYNNGIQKSKFIKYKPKKLATISTTNTNIIISLNREEILLIKNYFYLEWEYDLTTTRLVRLVDGDNIRFF